MCSLARLTKSSIAVHCLLKICCTVQIVKVEEMARLMSGNVLHIVCVRSPAVRPEQIVVKSHIAFVDEPRTRVIAAFGPCQRLTGQICCPAHDVEPIKGVVA